MSKRAATIAALETVYRSGYPRFFRVARAMVGDDDLARDAVQDCFVRAIRGRAGYRGRGSLEAWVWRTLVNVCADVRRSRVAGPLPREGAASNGFEQQWPELRAAIAALPERQRFVLFLRHYTDLDYETIASTLGIRRGTVAATLHAAHASLRKALKEVAR